MSRMKETLEGGGHRVKVILTNSCSNLSTRKLPSIKDNSTQNEYKVEIQGMGRLDGVYTRVQLKELTMKDFRDIAKKEQLPVKKTKEKTFAILWNWLSSTKYKNQFPKLKKEIEELVPIQKKSTSQNLLREFQFSGYFQ